MLHLFVVSFPLADLQAGQKLTIVQDLQYICICITFGGELNSLDLEYICIRVTVGGELDSFCLAHYI